MSLSRAELLKRGAVALAAGNIYSLLDGLAAAPARAAVACEPSARAVPALGPACGARARHRGDRAAVAPPRRHRARARLRPGEAARRAHAARAAARGPRAALPLDAGRRRRDRRLGPAVLPQARAEGSRRPALPELPADRPARVEGSREEGGGRPRRNAVRERRPRGRARRRRRRGADPQRQRRAHRRRAEGDLRRPRRRLHRDERPQRLRRRRLLGGAGAREADGARGRDPRRRPDRRRRADVPRLHVDAEGGDGARPDRELRDACPA